MKEQEEEKRLTKFCFELWMAFLSWPLRDARNVCSTLLILSDWWSIVFYIKTILC